MELHQDLIDEILFTTRTRQLFYLLGRLSPLDRDPAKYLFPRLFLAHVLIETFLLYACYFSERFAVVREAYFRFAPLT